MGRPFLRQIVIRCGSLFAGLVLGLGLGRAETLLAPWFVPAGLPAAEAQPLRAWFDRLQRESQTLLAEAARHNAACPLVPDGTPAAVRCRDELARLEAGVQRYNRDVQDERQAVWRAVLRCQETTARYDREMWRVAEELARGAGNAAALDVAHRQRAAAEARWQQLQTPVVDEFSATHPFLPPKIGCREERLVQPSGEGAGAPVLHDYVPDQAEGLLLQVTGSVYLQYHGQWVRVGPHTLIGPHDTLRTGPGSSATIVFGDGRLILLENSQFNGVTDEPGLESVKDLPSLKQYLHHYLQECLPAEVDVEHDPACGGTPTHDPPAGAPRG